MTETAALGRHDEATDGEPDRLDGRALELHPHVALRPEPFGALAYHYDNRRLVFLRHPDIVRVVRELADHADVAATLDACGIAPMRRPAFTAALRSLLAADILRAR